MVSELHWKCWKGDKSRLDIMKVDLTMRAEEMHTAGVVLGPILTGHLSRRNLAREEWLVFRAAFG